ncbi:condensation domain-containing protein [Micromonospora sp. NPDC050397]|uniref:condensation domain-containing protein n=1 Tax=Micromonospora sp. NPDC050397 TaxID=3364279 RepID=UPI00384F0AC5
MAQQTSTRSVALRAGEGWTGPLTWAQLAIWEVFRWLGPDEAASLNLSAVRDVPSGRTVDDVVTALRRLVERHDALRTRFAASDDGEPRQTVEPYGNLDVTVVEAGDQPPERAVEALVERMRAEPFEMATDLPLRAAVLAEAGRPLVVVLVLNHMAVDGYSLEIVSRDLGLLLDGAGELPPPGQQPRDRASYEASDLARRRATAALDYWTDGVRELPRALLVSEPGPVPQQWARITSEALRLAVRELADRHRMSLSMVVQALTGLLLGFYRRESRVGIRLIVATRFTSETRDYVGAFNQNGLLRLTVGTDRLGDFLRHSRAASMRAYQHCECDPLLLEARIAQVGAERGIDVGGYCFVNDVRPFAEVRSEVPGRAGDVVRDGDSPADLHSVIEAARHRTTVADLDRDGRQKGATFFLFLNTLGETARLTLAADGRFLAPGSARTFLADLEWLAVEALSGDPLLPELAEDWSRR